MKTERLQAQPLETQQVQPERVEIFPPDEHNAALVSNVHPPDWQNPEPAKRYNLVVLGAGTAGLVTAAGAAALGAKVALVERYLMGGDCLNVGCVPSKTIIRSSRLCAEVRDASNFGVRVPEGAQADFPSVMERMRRIRARISHHDSARRFRRLGVDVFLGEGRFAGPRALDVAGSNGTKTLRFRKAVIATGARAVRPPVDGLAEAGFLTNETVFWLTELPRRLVVFGAGPLGCELAQAFCRLGSEVTVVEMAPQLLTREDRDPADIIADSFRRDGISLLLNTTAKEVSTSNGQKLVHVERHAAAGAAAEQKIIAADEILVGAGRAPNVEGLNLGAAGVQYDSHRGVMVDDALRTSNPHIYAAGDVCLRHKFTHTADAAARIVIQNALFWGRKKLSALTIPWCTYTDPEIAHVGMYEKDAEERGISVETFAQRFSEVDRALTDGEEDGLVKIHVKKGTDKILGATIVARHAGEMISEITLAIAGGLGLRTIANVIHPYPTQAGAVKQVADAYNRQRVSPFLRRLLSRVMAVRR